MVVSFNPTSYNVTEGEDDFVSLTLARNGNPSRQTVVTVNPVAGTAEGMSLSSNKYPMHAVSLLAGSDLSSAPIDVTFGPGDMEAQVQILITDNSVVEDTEEFSATLSTSQSNVVFGSDTATVLILDDDCKD